jgi:hypothetical protein
MFDFGQERDKEEKRKREKWCCERRRWSPICSDSSLLI